MFTSQQIRQLRAKAHKLNPVVTLGQQGLTDNVNFEIDQALNAHELIKIRIQGKDKIAIKQLATEISAAHQAVLVQIIGHIIIIYRAKQDS